MADQNVHSPQEERSVEQKPVEQSSTEQSPRPTIVPKGPSICREFKAPSEVCLYGKSVFLAGSIDMGRARDWQADAVKMMQHLPITIMNPRRVDFGGDWVQDMSQDKLYRQVTWELDWLAGADVIALNLEPESDAPISILELGLFAASKKMVVRCPVGWRRRGNIQIICQRFGIPIFTEFEDMIEEVIKKLGFEKY